MPTPTPTVDAWFTILDSDDPDRVLTMITDDFSMSIVFSKGIGQAAEFTGDREGLVRYLEQREKSVLTHHLIAGATVDGFEIAAGSVTRGGAFEASFNVTAQLGPDQVTIRRLLICRTPELTFPRD